MVSTSLFINRRFECHCDEGAANGQFYINICLIADSLPSGFCQRLFSMPQSFRLIFFFCGGRSSCYTVQLKKLLYSTAGLNAVMYSRPSCCTV